MNSFNLCAENLQLQFIKLLFFPPFPITRHQLISDKSDRSRIKGGLHKRSSSTKFMAKKLKHAHFLTNRKSVNLGILGWGSKLLLSHRDEVEAFPIFENILKQSGRTVLFWKILFLFDFIKHSGFQKYIQRVILANK